MDPLRSAASEPRAIAPRSPAARGEIFPTRKESSHTKRCKGRVYGSCCFLTDELRTSYRRRRGGSKNSESRKDLTPIHFTKTPGVLGAKTSFSCGRIAGWSEGKHPTPATALPDGM